jgi:hypothetical protein
VPGSCGGDHHFDRHPGTRQEVHHFHDVNAEDVAAIVARVNRDRGSGT